MTLNNNSFHNISSEDLKDIQELEHRIEHFKNGQEDEERFKHYRLTRGVYGQRQIGVQMFRTKIPFGKLTSRQLVRLADISEKYTNGNLHLTTRQNVQMHHVKLEDSPKIWKELADATMTAREACGNTVRNITASALAGIDPNEAFDVSPYVQATFKYFLRNPICQEMGRKIKPAFSSSDDDSAFTYFHDFGFIPRLKAVGGIPTRGFKVVGGGGLGAVGQIAQTVYDFLETDRILPFMEAAIRVFDRYGEREKRQKARMKFLVKKLGISRFMELVEEEWQSLAYKRFSIDPNFYSVPVVLPIDQGKTKETPVNADAFQIWKDTNVIAQKQAPFCGVWVRIPRGDIHASKARALAQIVKKFAADDIRITVQQGFVLRFVHPNDLAALFNELSAIELARPGANSIADITACPGTDTCALGVTNSTSLSETLEEVLETEFEHLIIQSDIRIKISGCMNSCGQHMAAQIGFHGSSIKVDAKVLPAMQVVMGGGVSANGEGFIAEKVIKLPTKRIPNALRLLLTDFEKNASSGAAFNEYFQAQGKRYFYSLLKPLANKTTIQAEDFIDWGTETTYHQAIGVGECAGVSLDVVGTIIEDARQKLELAKEAYQIQALGDSIYHLYKVFVIGAKALLLAKDIKCNTHIGILEDFQQHYVAQNEFNWQNSDFKPWVLRMKKETPSLDFTTQYLKDAEQFFRAVLEVRSRQLSTTNGVDKLVIDQYYKA